MKKTTLSEAATQVVLGLPEEDLHEGLNVDQKRVISYLENFLKNVKQDEDINPEEVQKMLTDCEQELENLFMPSPRVTVEHLKWSILYDALEEILEDGVEAHTKRTAKDSIAAMKITVKLDRYY